MIMWILFAFVAITLLGLFAWRRLDHRTDAAIWSRLAARQPSDPARFTPQMIANLPGPAQRFFRFAIKPGTALWSVAEISMQGEFGPGNKAKPNYMPMQASQILAPPHGFVWRLRACSGWMTLSGSDGAETNTSWSRFWLFGVAPVARAGANADHMRSAFGRCIAEAVFWTPAALLPSDRVHWKGIDESTARVTLTHGTLRQAVDLHIDAGGKPTKVVFQRWSDANQQRQFQLQPFGGYLGGFRDFNGFRLPTVIQAGNFFGTDEYFPFFKVTVTDIRFPAPSGA